MNHTTTIKNLAIVAVLAAITAALTGTVVITIQTAAAYGGDSNDPNGNSIDKENSGTNSTFKQKEKNNCTGLSTCSNISIEQLEGHIACAPVPVPGT